MAKKIFPHDLTKTMIIFKKSSAFQNGYIEKNKLYYITTGLNKIRLIRP